MKIANIMLAFLAITLCTTTSGFQNSIERNALRGTSWQLVKYKDPDDKIFTPDEKSKYTIKFGRNGRVTARVDCNTASSTWKIRAKDELEFGSWDRTSAKCASGSLHDVIVNEGQNVRRFEIKDGHLFLWGMAAGGYYELEPLK